MISGNNSSKFFLIISIILLLFYDCESKTKADIKREQIRGDNRLLRGAYNGDISIVREALAEYANINCVMTKHIGENMLKIGVAGKDFPVATALAVAITGGTRSHLNTISFLISQGADPNKFQIESNGTVGYHPALMYGLGEFGSLNSSRIAMVQRLITSYPNLFQGSLLKPWLEATGRPPLLHTTIMRNSFESSYVIATSPSFNINETDKFNLTALHVSAWLGNSDIIMLLIKNGANILLKDIFNRTFFHYLACRQYDRIIHRVLLQEGNLTLSSKIDLLVSKDMNQDMVGDIIMRLPHTNKLMFDHIHAFIEHNFRAIQEHMNQMAATQQRLHVEIGSDALQEETPSISPYEYIFGSGYNTIMHVPLSIEKEISHTAENNVLPPPHPSSSSSSSSIKPSSVSVLRDKLFHQKYYASQMPLLIVGNATRKLINWSYVFGLMEGLTVSNISSIRCVLHLGEYETQGRPSDSTTTLLDTGDSTYVDVESCPDYHLTDSHQSLASYVREVNTDALSLRYSITPESSLITYFSLAVNEDTIRRIFFGNNSLGPFHCDGLHAAKEGKSEFRLSSLRRLNGNENNFIHSKSPAFGWSYQSQSAMWNILLSGESRKWFLVSPGGAIHIANRTGVVDHVGLRAHLWAEMVYPKLQALGLAYELTQRAGDVVYVPHGWGYVIHAGERGTKGYTGNSGQRHGTWSKELTQYFCLRFGDDVTIFNQVPIAIRMYSKHSNE